MGQLPVIAEPEELPDDDDASAKPPDDEVAPEEPLEGEAPPDEPPDDGEAPDEEPPDAEPSDSGPPGALEEELEQLPTISSSQNERPKTVLGSRIVRSR